MSVEPTSSPLVPKYKKGDLVKPPKAFSKSAEVMITKVDIKEILIGLNRRILTPVYKLKHPERDNSVGWFPEYLFTGEENGCKQEEKSEDLDS